MKLRSEHNDFLHSSSVQSCAWCAGAQSKEVYPEALGVERTSLNTSEHP